jgi:hypothetical protein
LEWSIERPDARSTRDVETEVLVQIAIIESGHRRLEDVGGRRGAEVLPALL